MGNWSRVGRSSSARAGLDAASAPVVRANAKRCFIPSPPASLVDPGALRGGERRLASLEMPELLTKHPDVVMKLLQQAGGKCGAGQEQTILKNCPPERFCTVPGGEMC